MSYKSRGITVGVSIFVACGAGACLPSTTDSVGSNDLRAICRIEREECTGFIFDPAGLRFCPIPNRTQPLVFQTTVCTNTQPGQTDADAAFQACNRYCNDLYDMSNEQCAATVVSREVAELGMCRATNVASNG